MKKIFTLIAIAMMAMTANAKLVLTELCNNAAFGIGADGAVGAWSWNQAATNDAVAHEEPEGSGNWITDKEATYNYGDLSAYDVVVVTFEELTCDASLVVVNAGWANKHSASALKVYKYVAVDMTAMGSVKNSIDAFVIQGGGEAGIIKIKEVSAMTAAEFAAFEAEAKSVKAEEDLALPGEGGVINMEEGEEMSGWYSPGWNGKLGLDAVYKTLVFEVASATADYAIKVQGSEDGGNTWDENGFSNFEVAAHTTPAVIAVPVEGKHTCLGQFAFQNLNVNGDPYMDPGSGKMVSWYDANTVIVTRIYLTSEVVESNYTPHATDGIENITVSQNNANVMYNIAGQRVNQAKGLVIMNGKKMIMK